jgi:two-component system heavy metal sensor histidine kinase CusS
MTEHALRPYSIGLRLSRLFALQAIVGFGLVSMAIYAIATLSLSSRADAELSRKAEIVKHLVTEASTGSDLPAIRHKLNEHFVGHDDLQVSVVGPDGKTLFESESRVDRGSPNKTARLDLRSGLPSQEIWTATIVMDLSDNARLLRELAALLVGCTLLGALGVSMSGMWTVKQSLEPLRGLAEQTKALRFDRQSTGRLSLRQPVHELQPLIEQFNALMERLTAAYRQLESFNADVAHELRTPLATIIGQTEVILSRPRSDEDLRDTLGSNLEEVRRLSSIVSDMLFMANADRGAVANTSPRASLAMQVGQVLEFYEGAIADSKLSTRVDGDAVASFEPRLVRRAISNLLSNAIRYADRFSEIVVKLEERDGQAWVVVDNAGPALPAGAVPQIFDRFFRAHPSRHGSSENHGLGLAIVAAIAKMHGGGTSAASVNGTTSIGFSIALVDGDSDEDFLAEEELS